MSTYKIYLEKFILPNLSRKLTYPYNVLNPKDLREIVFDPITILYGSNGSGKSTLLNIIARKLGVNCLTEETIPRPCNHISMTADIR